MAELGVDLVGVANDGVGLRLRFLAACICCGDNEFVCGAALAAVAAADDDDGDGDVPLKPLLNVLRADGGDLFLKTK